MKPVLAHALAFILLAGLLAAAIGSRRRSWPWIVWGGMAAGAALMLGNWIFL